MFSLSAHVCVCIMRVCISLFRLCSWTTHDAGGKRLSMQSATRKTHSVFNWTHSNNCAKYLEMPIFPILNSIRFYYMSLTHSQSIKDTYYCCLLVRELAAALALTSVFQSAVCWACQTCVWNTFYLWFAPDILIRSIQTMLIESRWLKNQIQCDIHRCLLFKLSRSGSWFKVQMLLNSRILFKLNASHSPNKTARKSIFQCEFLWIVRVPTV